MAGGPKYQPYPAYKPSGVEWLGDIPEGWEATRLKFLSLFRNEKRSATASRFYVGLENVLPWVGKHIPSQDQEAEGLALSFGKGDILFGKLRPYLAKSWLAETNGVCSSEFLVIAPSSLNPKYVNYLTLTEEFVSQVDGSTYGSKMPRANSEFIGQLKIPSPTLDQATKIAAFLDYETAKIDVLIAKQQRLIALLEEKRQAVISHAVTKGLDPTAPLRPSGIDWLGDVPAHWGVCAFKHVTDRVMVGIAEAATHAYRETGVPILRTTNVRPNQLVGEILYVDEKYALERGSKLIRSGDLLTVRTGTPGVTTTIPAELDGCQCFTMLVSTINSQHEPLYYSFYLNSSSARYGFSLFAWGSAQQNISVPILKDTFVTVPPRAEQKLIVEFIGEQTKVFDEMSSKAQSAITLLKERRTALISAAVTGKIDLRGWQAPAEAPYSTPDERALA